MARPNKNNMDYFSHDSDMRNDVKIKALRRKFSHDGYAVWNYILEVLTNADELKIEWNDLEKELFAADFDVEVDNLNNIVDYCIKLGLLQISDSYLFCTKHKQRLSSALSRKVAKSETQSINGKKGGNPNFKKGTPNPYYNGGNVIQSITEDNTEITKNENKSSQTLPNITLNKRKVNKRKEKDISDDISKKEIPLSPLSAFVPEEKLELDDLREKCLTSPIWLENAQRTLNKTGGEIFTLINSFVSELKAGGRGGTKTEQDFKTHFINWAKLQKNGSNKQSGKQTADERDADLAKQFATGTSLIDKISNLETVF